LISGNRTRNCRRKSRQERKVSIVLGAAIIVILPCRFKKTGTMWSFRNGSGYRALAILEADTFYWFWIGIHDDYDRLIAGT
jgi:hypothetical protein